MNNNNIEEELIVENEENNIKLSKISILLANFLNKYHKKVLLFWLFIFIIGLYPAKLFMSSVVLKYESPKGTDGRVASDYFKDIFPNGVHDKDIGILINTLDGSYILGDHKTEVYNFISSLNESVVERGLKFKPKEQIIVLSYPVLDNPGAHTAAISLLDKPNEPNKATAMLASISFIDAKYVEGSDQMIKFADWLDDTIDHLSKKTFY